MEFELLADPHHSIADQVLRAYEHRDKWVNRMILRDLLAAMNSPLHFEGLGGQVQMIHMNPPYGVKFGSNFQPFVRRRGVVCNDDEDMTREPEMVKAYRDTWGPRLHSYLTYLRDWLLPCREPFALDPLNIPSEAEMKAALPSNRGRLALSGPGSLARIDLNPYRQSLRFQQLVFDLAAALTRGYVGQPACEAPAQALFLQLRAIAERDLSEKAHPVKPAEILGWPRRSSRTTASVSRFRISTTDSARLHDRFHHSA